MDALTIEIEQGKLRGQEIKDESGNSYRSFQGIPYAKPPLGNLRFKAPVAADPWPEEIFDATKERDSCYARHMVYNKIIGSEDCLYLNVYAPILSSGQKALPTMFWIHGGGFYSGSGSSDLYGPEYLIPKNVVLVTFNYRVGFFGFLRLKDPQLGVTGNAGLKDQIAALRWVQKNIRAFGGDPENVTIFGESAGAASADLLKFTPQCKGLFHKMILHSGCSLNPWTFTIRKDYELAQTLGCTSPIDKNILEFLQRSDYKDIHNVTHTLIKENEQFPGEFNTITPVIEPNIPSAVITKHPEHLLETGDFYQVPTLLGYNSHEGLLMCNPKIPSQLRPNFTNHGLMVPRDLRNILQSDKSIMEVGQQIKEFYYGSQTPSLETLPNFVNYFTDVMFAYKIKMVARYLAKSSKAPTYSFKFSLDTNLNLNKLLLSLKYKGACHADDILYLFKCRNAPVLIPDSPEAKGVHIMTTLWTNFARTGNPNPIHKDPLIEDKWKPITEHEKTYVDIGRSFQVKNEKNLKMVPFWDGLYSQAKQHAHQLPKIVKNIKI